MCSRLERTARLALEQQNHEVIEASDGAEGAAKARELLPDLILCDIKMNNQADAGYTTLARLREDPVTAAAAAGPARRGQPGAEHGR